MVPDQVDLQLLWNKIWKCFKNATSNILIVIALYYEKFVRAKHKLRWVLCEKWKYITMCGSYVILCYVSVKQQLCLSMINSKISEVFLCLNTINLMNSIHYLSNTLFWHLTNYIFSTKRQGFNRKYVCEQKRHLANCRHQYKLYTQKRQAPYQHHFPKVWKVLKIPFLFSSTNKVTFSRKRNR